jgi:hypothetical protein
MVTVTDHDFGLGAPGSLSYTYLERYQKQLDIIRVCHELTARLRLNDSGLSDSHGDATVVWCVQYAQMHWHTIR